VGRATAYFALALTINLEGPQCFACADQNGSSTR
jgi:hypothetical protein